MLLDSTDKSAGSENNVDIKLGRLRKVKISDLRFGARAALYWKVEIQKRSKNPLLV
jgi:hypothetical protein